MNNKEIEELSRIALRQAKLISVLSECILDHASIIETLLPKCCKCNVNTVTVNHKIFGSACDRCAAELSCSKLDSTNECQVDNWVDTENADKVRRLRDFVTNAKSLVKNISSSEIH